MAHFAQLDETNKVTNVIVISNEEIVDENGVEQEELGIKKCKELFGQHTKWVQTSYNSNTRTRYAGIGMTYDESLDSFIPPKLYESWTFDDDNLCWQPPVPRPESGLYEWDEENLNWKSLEVPIEENLPVEITSESFRSQLTLTEKLLWDSPDTASTPSQKAVLTTFKTELPLTVGEETTTELLDLLVSEGVFTQQRLDEILSL